MQRVKYESTTTGTGDLTLTVPSGFQSIADSRYYQLGKDHTTTQVDVFYTLLDADGTSWEFGHAPCTATGLTRSSGIVFESTNSDAAINLSAGTHTVLISRSGMEGMVLQYSLDRDATNQSIAATTYEADITWTDELTELSGQASFNSIPGVLGLAASFDLPKTGDFNVSDICPFARAWRAHLMVSCTAGATGDMVGVRLRAQDGNFSLDSFEVEGWAPLINGQAVYPSCSLPWCNLPSGLNTTTDNSKGILYNFNSLFTQVHNSSSSSINVQPKLIIEFLL